MNFWETFSSQALASATGAAVGIGGVILAFYLQRRSAREEAFELAVQDFLALASDYVNISSRQMSAWSYVSSRSGRDVPASPNGAAVEVALQLMRLKVPKNDAIGVGFVERLWRMENVKVDRDSFAAFVKCVTDWRIASNQRNKKSADILIDLRTRFVAENAKSQSER